jgi:hypothetical protein
MTGFTNSNKNYECMDFCFDARCKLNFCRQHNKGMWEKAATVAKHSTDKTRTVYTPRTAVLILLPCLSEYQTLIRTYVRVVTY